MRRLVKWALILLVLCGWPQISSAQVAQATVVGRIQDSSGAVIPNVPVELRRVSTNERFRAVTTDTGDYSISNLPVGSYELQASAPGMRPEVRRGLTLEVGRTYRMDFTLTVGDVSQTVEVTSQAPLLNTEKSDISQVIDNEKIVNLPLNGRDVVGSLAALAPGITPARGARVGANTFGSYNIRGMRVEDTLVLVDGSMLSQNNGAMTYVQGPDSTQEFEIKTGLYGAEYGIRPGGVISLVTKSGTNEVHGTVYNFMRDQALDAKNYFNRGANPEFNRNQYGATIGGPIYLPRLLNGKDKAWFFFSFQGQKQKQFSSFSGTVPTPDQKRGIFTTPIRDPLTGANFANNTIPDARINPIARQFLDFWPDPNTPGALNYSCLTCSLKDDRSQVIAKADFVTSTKDRWSSRFLWDTFPIRTENPIQMFSRIDPLGTWAFNLVNTHIFSPTVVNELGFHYFRRPYSPGLGDPSGSPQDFDKNLGLPDFPRSAADAHGVLGLSIPGYLALGDKTFTGEAPIGNYQLKNNLSFYRGSHALKAGYEWRRNFTFNTFSQRSSVTFSSRYTGNAFADFLLGHLTSSTLGADSFWGDLGQDTHAFYIQDDWKATDKMTVNLGLRYEYRGPWSDHSGLSSNFNLQTGQLDPPYVETTLAPGETGRYEADVPLVEFSKLSILPRLGLSYSLTPKTVVRTGYGIYANEPYFNQYWFLGGNPRQNAVLRSAFSDVTTPNLSLSDPFSVSETTGSSFFSLSGIQGSLPQINVHQWGFSVQQQLSSRDAVEIGYQGSLSVNQLNLVKVNDASPGPGSLQARRPYPQYGNIDMILANGRATYHGLEAKYQRRPGADGLSLLVAYTFSKSIDRGSSGREAISPNVSETFNQGPGDGSIPGRLVITPGYRSPFGPGGRFLKDGVAGHILGNWSILGTFVWQAGSYLSAVMPSDSLNVGSTASFRPDLIGDPELSGSQRSIQRWFDTAAFAAPAPYTYGNAPRGIVRGPSIMNLDMGLLRDFAIHKSMNMQFRFEAFNVTNHPNFRDPGMVFGTSGFGVIGSAYDARSLQFGLKFIY
jgi:outer membrane receptor protein involved in Fe transport